MAVAVWEPGSGSARQDAAQPGEEGGGGDDHDQSSLSLSLYDALNHRPDGRLGENKLKMHFVIYNITQAFPESPVRSAGPTRRTGSGFVTLAQTSVQ